MDSIVELKSGYLSVHHKGILGGDNWSDKWCILQAGSSRSHACLYKCDSMIDTKNHKTLDLRKLSKVGKHKESNTIFDVVIKSECHFFKCKNEMDQASWIQAFEQILQPRDRSSKASRPTGSGDLIVEEKLLSQSVDDDALMFKVQVNVNEDSTRFGLTPDSDYYLAVHRTYVALLDSTKKKLIQWSYQYIKRFGHLANMIQINTGRKYGNGTFAFKTITQGNLILEFIFKKMINIAQPSPQFAKKEQSKLPNPPHLSKSVSLVEATKVPSESKEEKSHLSKSVNDETSRSTRAIDDSAMQNLELSSGSRKNTEKPNMYSTAEQETSEAWRQIGRDDMHQKDYENIRIASRNPNAIEGDYDMPEELLPNRYTYIYLHDDASNAQEEVDDVVRRPSITETGAYALPLGLASIW